MNKKILISILLFLPVFMTAHILLLNVFDNEDNTISVEGVFNTGELAVGALIRIEALNTGEILYKKRLPEEGELSIKIPSQAYQVVLDGGPGHQVVQKGIAPKEGFIEALITKKEIKLSRSRTSNKPWTKPVVVSLFIAFLLILLTIFVSIRNTNQLLKVLKETR